MRNIYLLDGNLLFYKVINSIKGTHVAYLTPPLPNSIELLKNSNSFKDVSFVEYDNPSKSKVELDYKTIEKYRYIQLKVYRYLDRYINCNNTKEYIYYTLFSEIYHLFKNNKIDLVLSSMIIHGTPSETIAMELAQEFRIPSYTLDICYGNPDGYGLYGIYDQTNEEFTDISKINNIDFNLSDYLYYSSHRNGHGEETIKKSVTQKTKMVNWLEKNSPFLFFIKFKYRNKELYNKLVYLRKCYKYYQKNSITPNLEENYIYYSLHFDPEASTMNREVISNQLVIIKMLSDNLPMGWKLFVKEHPAQYYMTKNKNIQRWRNYLSTFDKYRSKSFYDEINKLPNTHLISLNIPAKELIKRAKAISTINGTVGIEAIKEKKPLILFGDKTVLRYVKDIFIIKSTTQLESAIQTIDTGYKPKYSDIENIKNYMVELFKVGAKTNLNSDNETLKNFSNIIEHTLSKENAN